jgi:hypothetical protein
MMARRAGLYDALDDAFERNAFEDYKEAEDFALRRQAELKKARGEEEEIQEETSGKENLSLFLIEQ